MKERNNDFFRAFYICVLLSLVLLIGVMTPAVFNSDNVKELSSVEVYKKTFNSVVEFKAVAGEDEAYGSAVCVSSQGEFITNAHVISYTEKNSQGENELHTFDNYFIRFPDSDDFEEVTLEKYDIDLDLALVKLKTINRPLNVMKISDNFATGEKCYAVGNLQNYGVSITEGIISKKLVNIENNGKIIRAIQANLTITEGNSGGALISQLGDLIGITTFRTKDLSGKIIYGMAFSIPANVIIDFLGE